MDVVGAVVYVHFSQTLSGVEGVQVEDRPCEAVDQQAGAVGGDSLACELRRLIGDLGFEGFVDAFAPAFEVGLGGSLGVGRVVAVVVCIAEPASMAERMDGPHALVEVLDELSAVSSVSSVGRHPYQPSHGPVSHRDDYRVALHAFISVVRWVDELLRSASPCAELHHSPEVPVQQREAFARLPAVVLNVLRDPPVPCPEQREDIALDRVVVDDPDRLKGLFHREFLHHCVSLSVLILSAADDCDKS